MQSGVLTMPSHHPTCPEEQDQLQYSSTEAHSLRHYPTLRNHSHHLEWLVHDVHGEKSGILSTPLTVEAQHHLK